MARPSPPYSIVTVQNGIALVNEHCCICDQTKLVRKPLDDVGMSEICADCSHYVLLEFWDPDEFV